MSDLLPDQPSLHVSQTPGRIGAKALAGVDHLVVVLPSQPGAAAWRGLPEGARLMREARQLRAGDEPAMLRSRLTGGARPGVSVALLPESRRGSLTAYARLKFARDVLAEALGSHPRTLGLVVAGMPEALAQSTARDLVLAAGACAFRLPAFRRKAGGARQLKALRLLGLPGKLDLSRELAETEALNFVRWLTAMPPNRLDAAGYRELIGELCEHHDWSMRFLDTRALRRLGAGAFLAVARGNATDDAGIAHLAWRPRGQARPDVALVGKGIIFDTGGTNLKPFRAMLDMHQDMCGSAVALATLLAITRLKLPIAVDCWLAITENRIGPRAYKSRDVVTAANGTTVEVVHTDAEGRMVLADTLALAAREKPRLIIDYATLTGQCINALTERYSGVFTNDATLDDLLVATGRDCGERVWPFPMDEDYDEDIKSEVADVLQCSVENEGDHILAARFLERFVPPGLPWIHVDLAAASRKKGLGQVPEGPTGFGVRLTLRLLVERAPELAARMSMRPHADRRRR